MEEIKNERRAEVDGESSGYAESFILNNIDYVNQDLELIKHLEWAQAQGDKDNEDRFKAISSLLNELFKKFPELEEKYKKMIIE